MSRAVPPPSILVATVALLLAAATAQAQVIVWLDTQYGAPVLRKSSPTFTGITTLALPAGSLPEGIVLARFTGQLVWTEAQWGSASIQKGSLALTGFSPLAGGLSVLHGIAEDAGSGRLYFTSSNLTQSSSVYRCESDGSGVTTLISYGASRNLRGIAVDPAVGRMFYADFDNARVFAANLDGTGITQIASLASGAGPWGVAVDAAAQQVYWCEFGAGRIVRASYSGASQTALYTALANPTYLALDVAGSRIFWSEAGGTPRVRTGPLAGGAPSAFASVTGAYGGVAVVPAALLDAPVTGDVQDVELAPVSPNPARLGASVAFALPRATVVRLTLTDVQGRRVAVLAEGGHAAGRHRATLAQSARPLAAGLYFVRLETPERTLVRRISLLP